jgi:hypothetical protein
VTPLDLGERVWRIRKNHTWIDVQIRNCPGADLVEIQFFYDGALMFARRWPSREQALAHAEGQLRDFQRAGWNTHW